MKKKAEKDKSLTTWLIIFLCTIIFLLSYIVFMNWHKSEIEALKNENSEFAKKIERVENLNLELQKATSSAKKK